MTNLVFDIETIPQRAPLSDTQSEELTKKLNNYLAKRIDTDTEEARRLLMGTSPYFGEVVCIGLGFDSANGEFKTKALIGTEEELLTEFWNIVKGFNGTYVSYNGLEFDVPFIISRSMKLGIAPTNKTFIETRRFQKHPHFDVKQIMSDWDRYRSCTLNLACDHLGIVSPKEGEIKAKDVAQAFADGHIDKIAEYCLRDIEATNEVFKFVKRYTIMR